MEGGKGREPGNKSSFKFSPGHTSTFQEHYLTVSAEQLQIHHLSFHFTFPATWNYFKVTVPVFQNLFCEHIHNTLQAHFTCNVIVAM